MERSFIPLSTPTPHVSGDGVGHIRVMGSGAWHGIHCFQLQWDQMSAHLTIMIKELFPIVVACVIWGSSWQDQHVVCHCNNQAVVACLMSRTSRDRHCMHMLRILAFIKAQLSLSLLPQYILTPRLTRFS